MKGNSSSDEWNKRLAILRVEYNRVLTYQTSDPQSALMKARFLAEAVCKQVYILEGCEKGAKPAKKMMLGELVGALVKKDLLPPIISLNLGTIQHFGNFGSHDQGIATGDLTSKYIKPAIEALSTVISWYFTKYHQFGIQEQDSRRTTDPRAKEAYANQYRIFLLNDGKIDSEEEQTLRVIAEGFGLSLNEIESIHQEIRAEADVNQSLRLLGSSTGVFPRASPAIQWLTPPHESYRNANVKIEMLGFGHPPRTLFLQHGPSTTFGRDPSRSSLRLLVEPVDPPDVYAQNIQKSMDISSQHFAIDFTGQSPLIRDLNSTNGTFLSGQKLTANIQATLSEGDLISIASSLTLKVRLGPSANNKRSWLHLERTNNLPHTSYLLLQETLWFDPDAPHGFATQPQSLGIKWHENYPAVFNSGTVPLALGPVVLPPQFGIVAAPGIRLELDKGALLFSL